MVRCHKLASENVMIAGPEENSQEDSKDLPRWPDCDCFCIHDYVGTGTAPCGLARTASRGRLRRKRFGAPLPPLRLRNTVSHSVGSRRPARGVGALRWVAVCESANRAERGFQESRQCDGGCIRCAPQAAPPEITFDSGGNLYFNAIEIPEPVVSKAPELCA